MNVSNFTLTIVLTLFLSPLTLFIIIYNWRRRWLYYYGSKLPGPSAVPLIGCLSIVLQGPNGIFKFFVDTFEKYSSVWRLWLGTDLYIITRRPEDLKILLTRFLDKGDFYSLMSDYFNHALAAAPIDQWKTNRKNVTPTFNITLINSFVASFTKQAKILANSLEENCVEEPPDIFPKIWRCTLDAGCETLCDVDPAVLPTDKYLLKVFRIEDILLQRFFNPILHLNFFWKFSPLKKELQTIWEENCDFIERMIDLSQPSRQNADLTDDALWKKRFLNHLVDLHHKGEITHRYLLAESQIMFFVGTETSGIAITSVLLLLGMYPNVQKKINEELEAIFKSSDRDPSLEDVGQMEYLERVIKESMRLLPPIPLVLRYLDKDLELESSVFPAGSNVIVPIIFVHRNPDLWPDPLRFDPDRFLPEEVEKRHPCAFIPFSYGVRNCIGYKYGMLSMKIILSTVLRRYQVKSSNYKSIEEIDLLIYVIAKAKLGYKIKFEKKQIVI